MAARTSSTWPGSTPRDRTTPAIALLARTVDFLFGRGGDGLASDFKACSRRFALTYGDRPSEGASALDLTLHAPAPAHAGRRGDGTRRLPSPVRAARGPATSPAG